MRILYDNQDDILHIEFSRSPVVRDVSYGWNVNIGYSAKGIAEITVLDAKAAGYWPIENLNDLMVSVEDNGGLRNPHLEPLGEGALLDKIAEPKE